MDCCSSSTALGASRDPSHVIGSLVSDAAGWTAGPEGAAVAGAFAPALSAGTTTAPAAGELSADVTPPTPCAMLASSGAAQLAGTGSLNSALSWSTGRSAGSALAGGVATTEPRGVSRVPPPEPLHCEAARRRAEVGAEAAAAAARSSSSQAGPSSADAGATRECARGVVPPSFSA